MKTAVVLAGLMAALAISAQAGIGIRGVTITGTNASDSNVVVVGVITGFTGNAWAWIRVSSTNGEPGNGTFGMLSPPETITAVAGYCTWTNTSWNPYFTGNFEVAVKVSTNMLNWDNGRNGLVDAVYPTTVTVARTISGTMNSVQYQVDTNAGYNANGVFTNINPYHVFLQDNNSMTTNGAFSIPCSLMNNWPATTNGMTAEQLDMAFTDIAETYLLGAPFRFDMNLHKRPDSMIGFGEIKRFVWTPVSTAAPNGPGRLVVDVTSCNPWRNNYATNMQSSVGFSPLFMTNTGVAAAIKGMIMSTRAHYLDAVPDISDINSQIGIGLKVNGRSNTTSHLEAFIPDTLLATWGISVDMATALLAGYVTHFNANDVSKGDTTAVTTDQSFTRIVGGTNIVYAYNSGTSGDSGYKARFAFQFESKVAAQMSRSSVEGDIDGDRYADPWWPMKSKILGMYTFWFSSGGYLPSGPYQMSVPGGSPVRIADFDGDGLADPVMVDNARGWTFWFSSGGYLPSGPYIFSVPGGAPAAGDFDGDRLADPAMVTANGGWTFWFSSGGYLPSGPYIFSVPGGTQVLAGDFDGDRYADPVIVTANGGWTFWFSSGGYLPSGPYIFAVPGKNPVPMAGDFDGDGYADPAMVVNNNWTFWFSSGGYLPSGPYSFVP